MVSPADALPGRDEPIVPTALHVVLGTPVAPPYPAGHAIIGLAMGCFWGAERTLWSVPGVYTTAAGYAGGFTPNPTNKESCTGLTGHAETVQVVFDPARVSVEQILRVFWEGHDPTQKNRQGADIGTQYRSLILVHTDAHRFAAAASRADYDHALAAAGHPAVETDILDAGPFYFAEDYHQQYLAKNSGGKCALGGTGVRCQIGICHNDPG